MVLEAIGERTDLVIAAQSLGAFTAPIVCERRPAELLILLNGMIPRPGESNWWEATGHPVEIGSDFDPVETFLHDVPDEVRARAGDHAGPQAGKPMSEPYPLERWPDVPTRFVLSRDDRFFPADWQRGVVADRLGIEPARSMAATARRSAARRSWSSCSRRCAPVTRRGPADRRRLGLVDGLVARAGDGLARPPARRIGAGPAADRWSRRGCDPGVTETDFGTREFAALDADSNLIEFFKWIR